jgi:hypothetical protein
MVLRSCASEANIMIPFAGLKNKGLLLSASINALLIFIVREIIFFRLAKHILFKGAKQF